MVKVRPHSSNGKIRAYTLNHSREEVYAYLEMATGAERETHGILGLVDENGREVTKKVIRWEEITFMRDLQDGERTINKTL